MSEILIFGHKSPDTDSICASLVMEKFNKNNGIDAEAVRLGELNKETKYVLEKLGIEAPRLIEKVENNQPVILVDHNEFSQSVNNIENAKIEMVVDHHRMGRNYYSRTIILLSRTSRVYMYFNVQKIWSIKHENRKKRSYANA